MRSSWDSQMAVPESLYSCPLYAIGLAQQLDSMSLKNKKNTHLLITLLLVTGISCISLIAFGAKLAREERFILQAQYQRLYYQWLYDYRSEVELMLEGKASYFIKLISKVELTPQNYRDIIHSNALLEQVFVLSKEKKLLYPMLSLGDISQSEKNFINRTDKLWGSLKIFDLSSSDSGDRAWHSYFHSDGMHVIFIQRVNDLYLGFELNKSRLYAEIISLLPIEKTKNVTTPKSILRLLDEHGNEIHYSAPPNTRGIFQSVAQLNLSSPLQNIQVIYLIPKGLWNKAFYGSVFFTVLPVIFGTMIVLILLTIYFYRQHTLVLEDAAQKISFVNQVSHELKTPLTNIRMYAELLQQHTDEEDSYAHGHINVIIGETQRLSRLITSILSFSLYERNKLKLSFSKGLISEIISQVLENFQPSLQEKKIESIVEVHDFSICQFDADCVRQILGNLIDNVLKHSLSCSKIKIEVFRKSDEMVDIKLTDDGSGIPEEDKKHVFDPYYRGSKVCFNAIGGAGIGLSISRELARLHGGELCLQDSKHGASFMLSIRAPSIGSKCTETKVNV